MRSLKKCFVELEPSLSLSLSCRHGERHGLFLRTGCLPGFRGSCSFVVSSPGSRPIRWFPRRRKESLFFLLFSLLFVFAAWTSPKKKKWDYPFSRSGTGKDFWPVSIRLFERRKFFINDKLYYNCVRLCELFRHILTINVDWRRSSSKKRPIKRFLSIYLFVFPVTFTNRSSPSIFTGRCTAHDISVVRRRGNRDPTGAHASERRNNLEETWTDWFLYAKISLNYRVHLYFIIISRDPGCHHQFEQCQKISVPDNNVRFEFSSNFVPRFHVLHHTFTTIHSFSSRSFGGGGDKFPSHWPTPDSRVMPRRVSLPSRCPSTKSVLRYAANARLAFGVRSG